LPNGYSVKAGFVTNNKICFFILLIFNLNSGPNLLFFSTKKLKINFI